MEQEIDWEKEIYGRGYLRIDWERDRQKKRDFWAALDGMSSGVALMVDWHWIFGSAVDVIRPFLELTGEKTQSFPCPADPPCECRHAINETSRGELIAACCCDHNHCGRYEIEPEDVLFHGIRLDRFGEAIRTALGFAPPGAVAYVSPGLREIATYASAAVPVYLSLAGPEELLRELTRLLGLRDGPFLVLTPTGNSWGPEVEAMARPHAGGHISLSSVLECRVENGATSPCPSPPEAERGIPGGEFKSRGTIEPMLAEFARRMASLRGNGETLKSIHREIAAVRGEFGELRSAKQRLEKMLADGMFAFTKKVDGKSFHALCTILAEGDVSKAARALGMGDSTLRDLLRDWTGRGGAYKRMLEVVRWRKQIGRTETVRLNENIITGKAHSTDYPALLSEVLDGLLSMTEGNWEELGRELAEMLKAEIG